MFYGVSFSHDLLFFLIAEFTLGNHLITLVCGGYCTNYTVYIHTN